MPIGDLKQTTCAKSHSKITVQFYPQALVVGMNFDRMAHMGISPYKHHQINIEMRGGRSLIFRSVFQTMVISLYLEFEEETMELRWTYKLIWL